MPKKKNLIGKNILQMRIPDEYWQMLEKLAEKEANETGMPRSVGMVARDLLAKTLKDKKKK